MNGMRKSLIIIAVLTVLAAACKTPVPQGVKDPRILSIEVTASPDGISAVFVAKLSFNPQGMDPEIEVGVDILEDGLAPWRFPGTLIEEGFIVSADGLEPERPYKYRGFIKTERGEIYSDEETFTMGPGEAPAQITDFDWSRDAGLTPESVIDFADAALKQRLVGAFDQNKDGELSLAEAAAVKSFKGVLGDNESFTSFDEFRFFTGIGSLGYADLNKDYILDYVDAGFRGWLRLSSIVLPPGLKKIGGIAFFGCVSLSRVTIPEGLEHIGVEVFRECSGLKGINLPVGLKSIGQESFFDCNSLQSIVIPEGVEEIHDEAFKKCNSLKSVSLPRSLRSIGHSCFSECPLLRHIDLPEGLQTIGPYAFFGSGLLEVVIPETISSIQTACFQECRLLSSVSIPGSVMEICEYGFSQCKSLHELQLPEGILSFGPRCFWDSGITKIVLPSSTVRIGGGAFDWCRSLVEVRCLATNPPALSIDLFGDIDVPQIYVPASSVSAYRTANVWNQYANNIQAIQ